MALTATLTVDETISFGNKKMTLGSISMVASSTTAYVNGGIALQTLAGLSSADITTEDLLRRALAFNVEIKQIQMQPLFDGDGTAQEGYVCRVNESTAKLELLGGAGATTTAFDEAIADISDGTYVSNFIAIGV